MKDILPALFRDKLRNQDGHCSSFFFSPLCHLAIFCQGELFKIKRGRKPSAKSYDRKEGIKA